MPHRLARELRNVSQIMVQIQVYQLERKRKKDSSDASSVHDLATEFIDLANIGQI